MVEEIFQTGKSTVYIVFTQSNEVEIHNEALNKKNTADNKRKPLF